MSKKPSIKDSQSENENRNTKPSQVEHHRSDFAKACKNLHPKEIEAVRESPAEFGLYCENGIIFLLYRFGEVLPWSDSAFSWWNVAEEDRRIPAPQVNPMTRILLKIILVEAGNGIVKAIRVTTFSPAFTEKLHEAIKNQAMDKEFSREEFVARSLAIYESKTPADFAANAIVKTKGGD